MASATQGAGVTTETTVQEVLDQAPEAELIFAAHGCNPLDQCPEDVRRDLEIGDVAVICCIRDVPGLLAALAALLVQPADHAAARRCS